MARSSRSGLLRASFHVRHPSPPRDGWEARSTPQSRVATCQMSAVCFLPCAPSVTTTRRVGSTQHPSKQGCYVPDVGCVLPSMCAVRHHHATGGKHAAPLKAGLLRARCRLRASFHVRRSSPPRVGWEARSTLRAGCYVPDSGGRFNQAPSSRGFAGFPFRLRGCGQR
jgi:hypothetical protein